MEAEPADIEDPSKFVIIKPAVYYVEIQTFQKGSNFDYAPDPRKGFTITSREGSAPSPFFAEKSNDPNFMRVDMLESFDGKITTVKVNPSAMKDIQINYRDYVSVLKVTDPDSQVAQLSRNLKFPGAPLQTQEQIYFGFSRFFTNRNAVWVVDKEEGSMTQLPKIQFNQMVHDHHGHHFEK